eukprot:gnl/MRDRNA2_/MRDRNA2_206688_c0_seq1.p1 gnl/MRDRNA2_/MRDRNA2_206688_c0~~gnl/MRDRNA2_/MRDRNA2_206688_c0_seq1.p1  ORF type:complete len:435 (-),score=61.75 gnl/MRDRNA2_/MRDRNA2_206688_c0_seq1:503-1708(-)
MEEESHVPCSLEKRVFRFQCASHQISDNANICAPLGTEEALELRGNASSTCQEPESPLCWLPTLSPSISQAVSLVTTETGVRAAVVDFTQCPRQFLIETNHSKAQDNTTSVDQSADTSMALLQSEPGSTLSLEETFQNALIDGKTSMIQYSDALIEEMKDTTQGQFFADKAKVIQRMGGVPGEQGLCICAYLAEQEKSKLGRKNRIALEKMSLIKKPPLKYMIVSNEWSLPGLFCHPWVAVPVNLPSLSLEWFIARWQRVFVDSHVIYVTKMQNNQWFQANSIFRCAQKVGYVGENFRKSNNPNGRLLLRILRALNRMSQHESISESEVTVVFNLERGRAALLAYDLYCLGVRVIQIEKFIDPTKPGYHTSNSSSGFEADGGPDPCPGRWLSASKIWSKLA